MDKQVILIVDDNEINRQILSELLEDEYEIMEAVNGVEALEKIKQNLSKLSLILLDIMMPELDGFEVMKNLKREVSSLTVPIVFITASEGSENHSLQLGAVDFITKPFDPDVVKTRVKTHISLKNYRDQLEALLAYHTAAAEGLWDETFETLAGVCEYRDEKGAARTKTLKNLTAFMFQKVAEQAGNELLYFEDDLELLKRAAMTLDIGKVRIPEAILFKTGKLTDDEHEQMKKHTVYGAAIVEKFKNETNEKYISYCVNVCKYHHEKWDGTGYPEGLSGEQIPHYVRVISLLHVYNALISDRPYRKALSFEKAADMIRQESGKYFEPDLVTLFLKHTDTLQAIATQ